MTDKKLVFCFPYHGAGGVNMMFMRLASYFYQNGFKVALIDYPDGNMAKNKQKDIDLIPYFDDKEVLIPDNVILIFQSMTPWSIFPSLKILDKTKLFFITTLPANFYPVLPGFLRNMMYEGGFVSKIFWNTLLLKEYQKCKVFLQLLEEKSANVFLDSDIVCNINKSMKTKLLNPKLLPLFSQDVETNKFLEQLNTKKDILTLCWIGRLADFKINILNHVISEAFEYANKKCKEISFIIVGDGEYENKLFNSFSEYFSIKRIKYIEPSKLNDFMLNLDILFAMGTTALDGAKLGIPTVRLDYSYSLIPKTYKYKFFYEVKGYSMGERIDSSCFNNGTHCFEDLITKFNNEAEKLSNDCFNFYKIHHSINKSSEMLLNYISDSSLIWSDICKRKLNKSLLYRFKGLLK